jgi:hypothetical protein
MEKSKSKEGEKEGKTDQQLDGSREQEWTSESTTRSSDGVPPPRY